MRYSFYAAVLFSTLLFVSCGSKDEEADESTINTTTLPATTSATDTTKKTVMPPAPATTIAAPVLNNTTATAPVITTGLNPEHGKPGHRCDIAVGAPLNSAPASVTQPTVTPSVNIPATGSKAAPVVNTPVITPTTTTTTTTTAPVTGPGLNPEHGKPGHRCDIAVGAPLNSAPVAKTTQPSATIQPSITPAATPVIQPSVTPAAPSVNTDGVALNPEHGKPGHRCDIAVGAPLNSQPAKKEKE